MRVFARKGLFAVAAMISIAAASPALADPSMNVNPIHNGGSDQVTKTAESFSTGATHSFPMTINSGANGSGSASITGTIMVGTVTYRSALGTGPGCSFTTLINKVGATYSFSLSASPVPSGATTTCTNTSISKDTATGALSSQWGMSGF